MEKNPAEILDGLSIAKLKAERIGTKDTQDTLVVYQRALKELEKKYPAVNWEVIAKHFVDVNSNIWKYEAAIRQGVIDDNPAQIAARAILVREFNQVRVGLGNVVLALLGVKFINYKKDHVSE